MNQDQNDFLEAINQFANNPYGEGTETRRHAAISELLSRSNRIDENSILHNPHIEYKNYFDATAESSRSMINTVIRYSGIRKDWVSEASYYICELLWRVQGFRFILNDISERFKITEVSLIEQGNTRDNKIFSYAPKSDESLILNIKEFNSDNIQLDVGYFIIFELEDKLSDYSNSDCNLAFAYPIVFKA